MPRRSRFRNTAGDARPLLLARGFLLDDRGEHDRVPRGRQRQVGRRSSHNSPDALRHRRAACARSAPYGGRHSCRNRYPAAARLPAAAGRHRRRARRVAHQRDDLGAGQALGDSQPVLDGLAAGQDLQRLRSRSRRRRTRIRRPSARCRARTAAPAASKADRIADHPLLGQQRGDRGRCSVCGGTSDGARLGERSGHGGLAIEPEPGAGRSRPASERRRTDSTPPRGETCDIEPLRALSAHLFSGQSHAAGTDARLIALDPALPKISEALVPPKPNEFDST